jgi:hypothetical protein
MAQVHQHHDDVKQFLHAKSLPVKNLQKSLSKKF